MFVLQMMFTYIIRVLLNTFQVVITSQQENNTSKHEYNNNINNKKNIFFNTCPGII